jgi:hypothetical protein
MQSNERTEFDGLMDQFCAGMGVPSYDVRKEAFWKGLQKMSLIQFGRVVEHCLSEEGPDKIPNVPGIWKLWRSLAAAARTRSMPLPQPPEEQSEGLKLVSGMFLKYLNRRRVLEGFKGNIDVPKRRAACLSMVPWLDQAIAEDLRPSREELQRMFDAEMTKIPDLSSTIEWLEPELARQRREDQERIRRERGGGYRLS